MKTWIVLGMLSAAGVAHAAQPRRANDPAAADRREEADQRMRMMATLEIAEVLELDDAGALKLRQTVAQWDAQRAPLRQQMGDLAQVLRRAARGDTTAFGQVDSSIQKIIDLRMQLHQIDEKMFQQLSQGLAPQKKAKLALTMARMLRRGGGGGPRGEQDEVR